MGFLNGSVVKNPPVMQEMQGMLLQFLGQEDSLRGGHGNPLQYSCLENPYGERNLASYSHGVVKSQTRLKRLISYPHMPYFIIVKDSLS